MSKNANGKLKVYHLFPRNYNGMEEMTSELERIGKLGFNAVWISPLSRLSNLTVRRFNDMKAEMQTVKGSLYAAIDFSRLNDTMFPDLAHPLAYNEPSDGNPAYSTPQELEMMQTFTSKAKSNGLTPLFDLVLNHVGADSHLIEGTCPHFVDKGIDTRKWFQEKYEKYDDVYIFNYIDPAIRNEIIHELWIPYITKYINDFGFDGVRMDYAGTRLEIRPVEKIICNELDRLVCLKGKNAIIYAEVLPPTKKIAENARELRGMYSHVTNSALWGVEATQHERGMKQQITHLLPDGSLHPLPGGTIGFAGSHDNEPNARNAVKSKAIAAIHEDDYKRHIFYESPEKKQAHELKRAITEQIELARESDYKMGDCLLLQRKRLVSTALVSDGGWCLLNGDEFGKLSPASVFLDIEGKPLYNDIYYFNEAKQNTKWHHTGLIQDINDAIDDMPRSSFPHWAKIIHLPIPYDHLVIVMNYNGEGYSDPEPVLTIANVTGQSLKISDALIDKIANELDIKNPEASASVFRSKKQLIGPFELSFQKYEAITYYHPEVIPLTVSIEEKNSIMSSEPSVWEIDPLQETDICLTESQLRQFSIFKDRISSKQVNSCQKGYLGKSS